MPDDRGGDEPRDTGGDGDQERQSPPLGLGTWRRHGMVAAARQALQATVDGVEAMTERGDLRAQIVNPVRQDGCNIHGLLSS